jgi:radical SAM protein with 4Fe4S-binding SPASM domain
LYKLESIDKAIHVFTASNEVRDGVDVEFIKYISTTIRHHPYLHLYIYPIFDLSNDDKEFESDIMDKVMDLQNLLVEYKLLDKDHLVNLMYKKSRCFITHNNCYNIGPDGKLYGCTHVMDFDIGNIYDGPNEKKEMFMVTIPERCKTCIIYPLCKGGCKVAELGLAKINQCNTYKNVLDKFVLRKINNRTII